MTTANATQTRPSATAQYTFYCVIPCWSRPTQFAIAHTDLATLTWMIDAHIIDADSVRVVQAHSGPEALQHCYTMPPAALAYGYMHRQRQSNGKYVWSPLADCHGNEWHPCDAKAAMAAYAKGTPRAE